jgi:hypothetical protein
MRAPSLNAIGSAHTPQTFSYHAYNIANFDVGLTPTEGVRGFSFVRG